MAIFNSYVKLPEGISLPESSQNGESCHGHSTTAQARFPKDPPELLGGIPNRDVTG